LLNTISKIPDDDRRTIRGAACGSGIPKTSLHRMMKSNVLLKQNVHCKPFLKELNKVRRVEYILQHISHEALLDNFYSEVHIDEKWFYLHKVKRGIILHPDEPKRVQKCQSKRFVPKVMFMAAVARPRYDFDTKTWFDGLIGIFPFTEFKAAKRSSYRRKKGTMEQVPMLSITNVEHEQMLVDKVLPAIKEKFPKAYKNKTINIQLDNARPHTVRVDRLIEQMSKDSGWNIKMKKQPPNSPDLNVLDLVSDTYRLLLCFGGIGGIR
jgi:hypothetical protein